jgi:hypothetical protein
MGQVARFQLGDNGTGIYKTKSFTGQITCMYHYSNTRYDLYRLKVVLWVKKVKTGYPHHGGPS